MKKNIVVAGSSNMDMVVRVGRIPKSGETILGGAFITAHGGKGANQAVAAARAGGSVVFVSAVGCNNACSAHNRAAARIRSRKTCSTETSWPYRRKISCNRGDYCADGTSHSKILRVPLNVLENCR